MSTTTTLRPAWGARELRVWTDRIETKDSLDTSDSPIFDTEAATHTSMFNFEIPYLGHDPSDIDKTLGPDADAMRLFR